MRIIERRERIGASPLRSCAHEFVARVVHTLVGHLNPHCAVCGRTLMQIGKHPTAPCRRATLPFDGAVDLKAMPKKRTGS